MKKATKIASVKRRTTNSTKSRSRTDPAAAMSAAPAVTIDPAFRPVAAVFAKDPEVGLGRMFSSNSVMNVRGKIFAMFVRGRFVAKLPKERVEELVTTGAGEYFDPGHGRLMKEWVAIAETTAPWVALAREAYDFVKAGGRPESPRKTTKGRAATGR